VLGFSFRTENAEHIGFLAVEDRGGEKSLHIYCTAETVCIPDKNRTALALAAVLAMPQFWIESVFSAVASPINIILRHRPIAGYVGCTGRWLQQAKNALIGAYENRHTVYVESFNSIIESSLTQDSQSSPVSDAAAANARRPYLAITVIALWIVGAVGSFGMGIAASDSLRSSMNPQYAVEKNQRRMAALWQRLAMDKEETLRCLAELSKRKQAVQEIFRIGTGVTWDAFKAGNSPRQLDILMVSGSEEGKASIATVEELDRALEAARKLRDQFENISVQMRFATADERELNRGMNEFDEMRKECARLTEALDILAHPVRIIGVLMKAENR